MSVVAVPDKPIPNGVKFLFGGLAGMAATVFVQPLDLIKTRMQLSGGGRSSFSVGAEIFRKEGLSGIYTGLSAGLLRQATYTTTRLGIYTWLFDMTKRAKETPVDNGFESSDTDYMFHINNRFESLEDNVMTNYEESISVPTHPKTDSEEEEELGKQLERLPTFVNL